MSFYWIYMRIEALTVVETYVTQIRRKSEPTNKRTVKNMIETKEPYDT